MTTRQWHPHLTGFAIGLALLFCAGNTHASHPQTVTVAKEVYSFGVVPQFEQRKLFSIWQPILDQLESLTGLKFQLTGTTRIPSFEKDFTAGVYDFAYMNAYQVAKCSQYEPIIRDGARALQGIIVVHRDSDINSIADLDHQEMVFPSPNAFGASLLIRKELKERHKINIIPKYAQTHSSAYLHVAKGLSRSGGGVQSTFNSQDKQVQNSLRVLYRTRALPAHPISAHARVPEEVREKVRAALLTMAATETGKRLLARVPMEHAVSSSKQDYDDLTAMNLEAYLEE